MKPAVALVILVILVTGSVLPGQAPVATAGTEYRAYLPVVRNASSAGPLLPLAWGTLPTPNAGSGDNILRDVSLLPGGQAWAVGTDQTWPKLAHFQASVWRFVPAPHTGVNGELWDIEARGPYDLWASGAFVDDATYNDRSLAMNAPSATQGAVQGEANVGGAVITYVGPVNGSTTTNAYGQYSVGGLPAGTYTFIASDPGGCNPAVATVMIAAGTEVTQDFNLSCK